MPSKSVAARSLIPTNSEENWEVDVESGSVEESVVLKDGKRAWLVCAAGFLLQVLIVGMLHVFGVFFVEFIKEFHKTKGEIAWVGSAAYGLSMAFGPVTGMLVHRYGNRPVTMAGCFICAVSSVVSSFANSVEMLFLTYSLMYGVGTSLAYTPTMTIAQDYFDKYVAIATGIMTAGSSTGTLILAPLTQYMVDIYGWRVAFRFFTGTCLFTVLCALMFKPLSKKNRHPIEVIRKSPLRMLVQELKLWKDRVFIVWVTGITFVMFGYYIPYVHLVSYANDVGVPPDQGSMLVMLLGGSTAVGRILFGKIVEYGFLNRLHLHQMSMVITGTGAMLLPLITTFGGLAAYVVCVGLVDGCFVVLLPLMTATLVGSERTIVAWGFLVGASSITFTLGPPVAGWIYDYTGSYKIAFHVAGVPIVLGALILFLIPWAQRTSKRSNVLKIINVSPPENRSSGSGEQSPMASPVSSPMCGTHATSVPPHTNSACFSNASISSTKNVSMTLANILDKSYQPLSDSVPDDQKPTTSSDMPLPSTAVSTFKSVPIGVTSLPANLHLPLAEERSKSGLSIQDGDSATSNSVCVSSVANVQKELFQRQKNLMLSTGRVRAKSWSESGQRYREKVHVPQATKSERHRDLISFEARSQLAVDNADKARGLGRRMESWNYRQVSSSQLTLEGVTSTISSDVNYQADVSQQASEESFVNMFDSFGMAQFGGLLSQNSTLAQSNGSLQADPSVSVNHDNGQTASVLSGLSSPTNTVGDTPVGGSEQAGFRELPDSSPDTPSSSQMGKLTLSSSDKLPTITEHKAFQDSAEGLSDAVSDLIQIALLSNGAEG